MNGVIVICGKDMGIFIIWCVFRGKNDVDFETGDLETWF